MTKPDPKETPSKALEIGSYLAAMVIVVPLGWWLSENEMFGFGKWWIATAGPFFSWLLGLFGIS